MGKIKKSNNRTITSRTGYILIVLAIIHIVLGCTAYNSVSKKTKNVARGFKALDKDLNKKVALAYYSNQTVFSDRNLETNFHENLIETIGSLCPRIFILPAAEIGIADYFNDIQRQNNGGIDNLELVKRGRLHGLNAILMVSLTGVVDFEEEKGIWRFKDTHYYFRVQMIVGVFDTETGTKLLDEVVKRMVEVDEYDLELLRSQNRIDAFIIEDAFEDVADAMGEKICDVLSAQPWKGYIVSIKGDKINISSGIETGLVPGKVLEVFYSTKTIEGANGRRFFIPGKKIGEVEITTVYEDSAEAAIISNNGIQAGSLVKVKP